MSTHPRFQNTNFGLRLQLRALLAIPADLEVRFDRFSDSAGAYITLDSNNAAIYKQLYRAAKAKLKLRLRATVEKKPAKETFPQTTTMEKKETAAPQAEPRNTFLETVLSKPSGIGAAPSFKSFQQTCQYSPKCAIPGAFDLDLSHVDPAPKPAATLVPGKKDVYSLPTLPSISDFPSTSYTIDCNHCGSSVPNEHYHCGICEAGDFDLCKTCIDAGITCDGEEHWLLKRTIRHGVVIPSTTETLPPKKQPKDASDELVSPTSPEQDSDDLTCNSCICRTCFSGLFPASANVYPEMPAREFVTCQVCSDFDLCWSCFQEDYHGHDPAHGFEPRDVDTVPSDGTDFLALCAPGRDVPHAAICDGCEEVS
jgi:next to BRCA1 gene 1 protein